MAEAAKTIKAEIGTLKAIISWPIKCPACKQSFWALPEGDDLVGCINRQCAFYGRRFKRPTVTLEEVDPSS